MARRLVFEIGRRRLFLPGDDALAALREQIADNLVDGFGGVRFGAIVAVKEAIERDAPDAVMEPRFDRALYVDHDGACALVRGKASAICVRAR